MTWEWLLAIGIVLLVIVVPIAILVVSEGKKFDEARRRRREIDPFRLGLYGPTDQDDD
jgi:hypothetical protein